MVRGWTTVSPSSIRPTVERSKPAMLASSLLEKNARSRRARTRAPSIILFFVAPDYFATHSAPPVAFLHAYSTISNNILQGPGSSVDSFARGSLHFASLSLLCLGRGCYRGGGVVAALNRLAARPRRSGQEPEKGAEERRRGGEPRSDAPDRQEGARSSWWRLVFGS